MTRPDGRLVSPDTNVLVDYKPQGATLRKFHNSKAFLRGIIGPLGSGKTQATIFEVLRLIDCQTPDANGVRRSRWVAARNSFRDLRDTTIKDWRAWTDGLKAGEFNMGQTPGWTCRYRRADGTTVDAEVLFRAFDGPEDEGKARGMQLTGVWFNEFKELSLTNVEMLMSRVGRYPGASVRDARYSVLADSNAPDRDHWLAKFALDNTPQGWEFFIQPGAVQRVGGQWIVNDTAENLINLPPGYYDHQVAGKRESWIRQNIANEFVHHADGRPVHPDFNESLHVARVGPRVGTPIIVGVDFGRTPAATFWQRQHNGAWHCFDEVATVNTSALAFGQILRRHINGRYPEHVVRIWGDPAGNQQAQTRDETPFDMLRSCGLDAMPAPTNDFEKRTTALDENLRQMIDGVPAVQIDPACKTLIRGLAGSYQFKRVRVSGEDRFHDQPVKDPTSHVVESAHYALLGEGEGEILFTSDWAENMKVDDGWAPAARLFE